MILGHIYRLDFHKEPIPPQSLSAEICRWRQRSVFSSFSPLLVSVQRTRTKGSHSKWPFSKNRVCTEHLLLSACTKWEKHQVIYPSSSLRIHNYSTILLNHTCSVQYIGTGSCCITGAHFFDSFHDAIWLLRSEMLLKNKKPQAFSPLQILRFLGFLKTADELYHVFW